MVVTLYVWWGMRRETEPPTLACYWALFASVGTRFSAVRSVNSVEMKDLLLRPGHAMLPSAYLLSNGIRRTLKTKTFNGRGPPTFISIASLTACRVSISPRHKISHSAYQILDDRSHVLYLPTRKRFRSILDGRYDERQEGLWMSFTGNPLRMKRVVRSWATRRIKQAVTEALRTRGFDGNGRRLANSPTSTLTGSESNYCLTKSPLSQGPEALIGTVNVQILPSSIETSFTEVQRQARVMVGKILDICGRYH